MPKQKLTDDLLPRVQELRAAGRTILACAQSLGVTHTTLRRFMRRHGLSTDHLSAKGVDQEYVARSYAEGKSVAQLVRELRRDRQTVLAALAAAGVKRRTTWSRRRGGARLASELDGQRLRQAYESGQTLQQLAADEGVAPPTIRKALLAAGTTLRRTGPEQKDTRSKLAARLFRLYGITADDYNQLLAEQGEQCAICGCGSNHARNHGKSCLCVDHCHTSGQVRGLLCQTCNIGISYFADSGELLRGAAQYLDRAGASL